MMQKLTWCDPSYDDIGLNETLDTIFHGLQSPAFESLVALTLRVPTTHDAARLGAALDQDARLRLRHLKIVIVDSTGPSGSVDYTCEEDNEDGQMSVLIESGYVPSSWHARHPNQTHQGDMFDFVTSCRSLKHLSLEATQYLDLDRLDLTSLGRLEVISLSRFWATMPSLLGLATPLTRRVILYDIKVRGDDGQWSQLFRRLREDCPYLDYFHIYQCSYLGTHPSYEHNNRPWENSNPLWTCDEEDAAQLRGLIARMMRLAGGRAAYPGENDYYEPEYPEEEDR